jgi:hypothetical protein
VQQDAFALDRLLEAHGRLAFTTWAHVRDTYCDRSVRHQL